MPARLQIPRGFPGTGCGFAWADIMWGWERRERDNLFSTSIIRSEMKGTCT